jgi:hypothetical protein
MDRNNVGTRPASRATLFNLEAKRGRWWNYRLDHHIPNLLALLSHVVAASLPIVADHGPQDPQAGDFEGGGSRKEHREGGGRSFGRAGASKASGPLRRRWMVWLGVGGPGVETLLGVGRRHRAIGYDPCSWPVLGCLARACRDCFRLDLSFLLAPKDCQDLSNVAVPACRVCQ